MAYTVTPGEVEAHIPKPDAIPGEFTYGMSLIPWDSLNRKEFYLCFTWKPRLKEVVTSPKWPSAKWQRWDLNPGLRVSSVHAPSLTTLAVSTLESTCSLIYGMLSYSVILARSLPITYLSFLICKTRECRQGPSWSSYSVILTGFSFEAVRTAWEQ